MKPRLVVTNAADVTPRQRHIDHESMIPYGYWTARDGRLVVFNRKYAPILVAHRGVLKTADPNEWVDIDTARPSGYFWGDGTARERRASVGFEGLAKVLARRRLDPRKP